MYNPAFTPIFTEDSHMYFMLFLCTTSSCPFPYLPIPAPSVTSNSASASSTQQDHHNFLGIQLSVSWLKNYSQAEDQVIVGSFYEIFFSQRSVFFFPLMKGEQTLIVKKKNISSVFSPSLLRTNWHTSLYMFKAYSLMVWFAYIFKWLPQWV